MTKEALWTSSCKMITYYLAVALVLLLSFNVLGQATDSDVLLPIVQNGRMGYISNTGEIRIKPQFEISSFMGIPVLSDFREGLAAVKLNKKIGYINASGQIVIAAQFKDGREFSEGLAAVKIDDKWGYVDKRGSLVITTQFKYVGDFSEGLAQVEIGGKLGYIDKAGKIVIEPRFRHPEDAWYFDSAKEGDFKDGLANVREGMNYLIIDRMGKTVGKCVFDCLTNFSDGMALIRGYKNGRPVMGYMDKKGMIAIEPKFGDAKKFSEGLAPVRNQLVIGSGGWYFIDHTGQQVIKGQFFYASPFSDGLAAVAALQTRIHRPHRSNGYQRAL